MISDNIIIKINKRIKFNLKTFINELKEVNFPFEYLDGLNEINFTILKSDNDNVFHGDYLDNKIRVSFNSGYNIKISRIFVHEVGHHVDETKLISDDINVIAEWNNNKDKLSFSSKHGVDEYVADGFEIYYCGNKSEKRKLKTKYKELYKIISTLHKEQIEGVKHGIKH